MYVITVVFEIKKEHTDAFATAMRETARASLENELGCHQFDVAFAPDDATTCFLYELYTDKAAFNVHLATPHFKSFDATVASWLNEKSMHSYERPWPTD